MTTHNGIETPCFGTLKEIHAALVGSLNWKGQQVSINGWGYMVTEAGFQSNGSGNVYQPGSIATRFRMPGTAILIGLNETGFSGNYDGSNPDFFEIVTSGKVPHVSERCQLCGAQLNKDEIKRRACDGCYAEEVGH